MEAGNATTITAARKRTLLTKWAGQAWREIDAKRRADEQAGLNSGIYNAFLHTGMLATCDDTLNNNIHPHASIKGDFAVKFDRLIMTAQSIKAAQQTGLVINL